MIHERVCSIAGSRLLCLKREMKDGMTVSDCRIRARYTDRMTMKYDLFLQEGRRLVVWHVQRLHQELHTEVRPNPQGPNRVPRMWNCFGCL